MHALVPGGKVAVGVTIESLLVMSMAVMLPKIICIINV